MSKPLPTRNKRPWLLTGEEIACALGGAIGASLMLGAWSFVAWYTVLLFALVIWKTARS